MKPKERCFRIPAKYAAFSSGLFSQALSFWFSEPPLEDRLVSLRTDAQDTLVQKKITLGHEDSSLFNELKDIYKIEHDYEVVSLVIAHAVTECKSVFAA